MPRLEFTHYRDIEAPKLYLDWWYMRWDLKHKPVFEKRKHEIWIRIGIFHHTFSFLIGFGSIIEAYRRKS